MLNKKLLIPLLFIILSCSSDSDSSSSYLINTRYTNSKEDIDSTYKNLEVQLVGGRDTSRLEIHINNALVIKADVIASKITGRASINTLNDLEKNDKIRISVTGKFNHEFIYNEAYSHLTVLIIDRDTMAYFSFSNKTEPLE